MVLLPRPRHPTQASGEPLLPDLIQLLVSQIKMRDAEAYKQVFVSLNIRSKKPTHLISKIYKDP